MDEKQLGERASNALLYTNARRMVVYANWHFMQIMNYAHEQPIIGEPLAKVLGIDPAKCESWFASHRHGEEPAPLSLEVPQASGPARIVLCRGRAVFDANKEFVGLNMAFTFAGTAPLQPEAAKSPMENPARSYTLQQVEAIRVLLARIIGLGVVERLDEAINASARQSGWPVEFGRGPVRIEGELADPAILREVLSQTVRSAVDVAGSVWIAREMQDTEAAMPADLVTWAEQNGFRSLKP